MKKNQATRPQVQALFGEMIARKQKVGLFIARSFPDTVKDWVHSLRQDGYVIELKSWEHLKAHRSVISEVTAHPIKKSIVASDSEIQEVRKKSYDKRKKVGNKRKISKSVNNTKVTTSSRNKSTL
ncbi:MAG: hypothetical protein OXK80_03830 [Bdellovibrionales bacterium]|nr:hypothetical protein [Bdellovibrionales bacterium]